MTADDSIEAKERPYEQLEIEQRPTTSYKDSLGKFIVEYLKGKGS